MLARFANIQAWSESTVILDKNLAFVDLFFEGRAMKPDSSEYKPTGVWILGETATLAIIPQNYIFFKSPFEVFETK